ncbi:MAG: fumarylacetoacetate hydrolase family protein [Verrucomicrobiota bacterium]
MRLTKHQTSSTSRWALDGKYLSSEITLSQILEAPAEQLKTLLLSHQTEEDAAAPLLAPIDADQEVWASGVTYLSSRMAREAESQSKDVYQKVYDAERPELFFKSQGNRVRGHGENIRIRKDSQWDVPEPELTLVINSAKEVIGYTVGNDVSSRSIEGENPLYLPQAKVYHKSCGLGPAICIASIDTLKDLPIQLVIERNGSPVFTGETQTSQIKRTLEELVEYLYREMPFPHGSFLMTGTGIIPAEEFTLQSGDLVRITIADLILENPVE